MIGDQWIMRTCCVWVCDFAAALPLATMLRQQLQAITQARVIDTNRSRLVDDVYEYVCGREFQHHVTNTVTAAVTMKRELDSERTAAERTFKKRDKQIETQLRNLAGMYGGLQGMAGGALQPVAPLELPPRHRRRTRAARTRGLRQQTQTLKV